MARRSDEDRVGPLTWNGGPMPFLHLNARSRHITGDFEFYRDLMESDSTQF